jgi:hypothetical protein
VNVGQSPPSAGDGQVGAGRTDDPMSADRRVLTVAAISMVALVLVGVVSAQLFARSACGAIDPRPHGDRIAGADLEAALTDGLPDLGGPSIDALATAVDTVAALVGPVTGAADVRGADRLAIVDGEVAALGRITTVLAGASTEVRATRDLDEGTVVGDGATLYSLALVNELTAQVDAIQPLDGDLGPGTCVDTATVGTPLAFHLDAGAGELLLLRTEEDGDEPAVELRDAVAGRVWSTPVDVGTAPAGVLAERVAGRLGEDLVVVGRRIGQDEDEPAVVALDRADGEQRWSLPIGALVGSAPPGDGQVWPTVLTVGDELALVALAREEDRAAATVVALDVADGTVRWHLDTPVEPLAAATSVGTDGEGAVWLAARVADEVELLRLTADGERVTGSSLPGDDAALAHLDADTAVLGSGATLLVSDPDGQQAVTSDARVLDLAADGSRLHVLYGTDEGAVVVSFAVAGD